AGFEARNLGLLPGAGSPSMRIESARAELSQIETQLAGAQSGLAAANAQLGATPATINVPGMSAVGGGVARQQLASAQAELSGMRARGLTESHPDVIALQAQIAALRAQASREPTGVSGGSSSPNPAYSSLQSMRAERQAQVTALLTRRGQLQAEMGQISATQTQQPAVAAEYDRLNRDYNMIKDQYDRLSARREQVRLRGAGETMGDAVRVEVLDRPTSPTAPAKPNKPLLLFAVLFAGLGGGIAAAFAMSQVQTTYPTAARLSRASGLPVIGSVTEILTDDLKASRRARMGRLALAGGGLAALCVVLLVVEIVQRGTVG
ncbi:MAG: GNVR domain-containing protein, partial [Sphingopyxis sp.]